MPALSETGSTTSYSRNSLNQYTSVGGTGYSYDNNGNLTDDGTYLYYYDCENRLTDVNDKSTGNPVSSYSYDYQGRRISKTVSGVTTKYCYDGARVIAEYDGSNTLLRKFIYGPGIDKPICMIDVADGNTIYYYHFDGLGSVIALSDVNSVIVERYSYDVFGKPNTTSTIGNPYLFTGRRYEPETGLYYYRARYYAYDIGRFLQTDPIGYDDNLNVYAYCGNNSLEWVDPYGLCKDGSRSFFRKVWDGDYVGAQYGDQALDGYAYQIAFGDAKWYHYVGGFFSAMWTPKSWKTTTLTLGSAGVGAIKARMAARATRLVPKGGGLADDIVRTFRDRAYKTRVLQSNVRAYRYSGGVSPAKGSWLTTRQTVSQIATPANAQKLLNLPSGATAETLNTFVIPKGTTLYMGRVAGGGAKATQVFIENPNLLIQLGI